MKPSTLNFRLSTVFLTLLILVRGCQFAPAQTNAENLKAEMLKCEARFAALSQIESGDNDLAVGKDGERGRYQITENVWRETYEPRYWRQFQLLTNADFALAAAQAVMFNRQVLFRNKHHREPTDFEWYLLWHRTSRVLNPRPVERERAERFANLVRKFSTK